VWFSFILHVEKLKKIAKTNILYVSERTLSSRRAIVAETRVWRSFSFVIDTHGLSLRWNVILIFRRRTRNVNVYSIFREQNHSAGPNSRAHASLLLVSHGEIKHIHDIAPHTDISSRFVLCIIFTIAPALQATHESVIQLRDRNVNKSTEIHKIIPRTHTVEMMITAIRK